MAILSTLNLWGSIEMSREILRESQNVWFVSCKEKEDGGARLTMDSADGFFTIEYDAKWGKYGRFTMKDDEKYPNFEEAYKWADRQLYSVEENLIMVD